MDVLHVSRAEYEHILAVVDSCRDLMTGQLNEWQAVRVLASYYSVEAFKPTRIVVHPEVPDDFRLSHWERDGRESSVWESTLENKLERARARWAAQELAKR